MKGAAGTAVQCVSGYVSRRTDRRTLEILGMVYCGRLNKMWHAVRVVEATLRQLSRDGRLFRAGQFGRRAIL